MCSHLHEARKSTQLSPSFTPILGIIFADWLVFQPHFSGFMPPPVPREKKFTLKSNLCTAISPRNIAFHHFFNTATTKSRLGLYRFLVSESQESQFCPFFGVARSDSFIKKSQLSNSRNLFLIHATYT